MTDFEDLTFEAALRELEEVVQKMEEGTVPLEETVSLYERGRALAEHCQRLLDDIALRVQSLAADGKGGYTTVPFEDAEG